MIPVKYEGKSQTEWSRELSVSKETIRKRLNKYGTPYGPYDPYVRELGLSEETIRNRLNKWRVGPIIFEGKTSKEWENELGVSKETIRLRMLDHGTPHSTKASYQGKSIAEWGRALGVNDTTIRYRLHTRGTPYAKSYVTECEETA